MSLLMEDLCGLSALPSVPLLEVARHLNNEGRRSLSQCCRRFRRLIWDSDDISLDCRIECPEMEISYSEANSNNFNDGQSRIEVNITIWKGDRRATHKTLTFHNLDQMAESISEHCQKYKFLNTNLNILVVRSSPANTQCEKLLEIASEMENVKITLLSSSSGFFSTVIDCFLQYPSLKEWDIAGHDQLVDFMENTFKQKEISYEIGESRNTSSIKKEEREKGMHIVFCDGFVDMFHRQ